jgi:hypothetical protein
MKCLICNNRTYLFLIKKHFKDEYNDMINQFKEFHYYKCIDCGFTVSKTHIEMSTEQWIKLNHDFHHYIENNPAPINQPPYLEQAMVINILSKCGILNVKDSIDYAGGYGTLSRILKEFHNIQVPVFDPYINVNNSEIIYLEKCNLKTYSVLINSALFEHLFTRESFNEINSLIENNGCMILHTVVCENIPKDENWFYFEPPVHCAFHTNKSMDLLMAQWGFISSIYIPVAKIWVLFKYEPHNLKNIIINLNQQFQKEIFIYKKGFVDFWKGF